MANGSLSLSDIRATFKPLLSISPLLIPLPSINPLLSLDERTVGQKCFDFLKRSFRQQAEFALKDCVISEDWSDHLTVSGTFARLFPWGDVGVTISFIDYPGVGTANERGCVFSMVIPQGYTLASYLSQYCLGVDESVSSADLAVVPHLQDYVQALSFRDNARAMVFSSVDYTIAESKDVFYPNALETLLPKSQVKAGINCVVNITLVEALETYFRELFGASYKKNDKGYGVIYPEELYPGEYGRTFLLRSGMEIDANSIKVVKNRRPCGPFDLKFTGTGITFPLIRPTLTGPQIVFEGDVRIAGVEFRTRADYNAYYDALAVSFYKFPSLKEIINLSANAGEDETFVNLISSVLNVKLSSLGVVLSLRDRSVSEISCSVTSQTDVQLIENIISVKPTVNMRIRAPFDSELRSIEGELSGDWKLGRTNFETALYYPGFAFRARMASTELDVDEVVRSILGSIAVPKLNMKLTKMEVWGNFLNKSFSAEIDADYEWSFLLGSYAFGLGISKLLVTYDNRQVSCALDGKLKLAGVDVFILAQYDSELGWKLSGGTPVGEIVDFAHIAEKLLESLSLPATVPAKPPKLGLKNIIFSATPKRGEYSLGCEAAESWTLMDGVELKVDRFRAEKSQGSSVTGLLSVSLTIKDTVKDTVLCVLWLSAEKAAAAKGGWKFEGGSAERQSIQIADIVKWMGAGNKFGSAPQLPDAVENFTIDKLKLSFESEKKDFFFTCEGKVRLPELADPIQGIITIDIKHQEDKSFTKLFGGSLIIDGMEFDLIFESSDKASTFVAAYHDDKGHTIKIDDLTKRVFKSVFAGEAPTTGLEISLRDALFAYQKAGQSTKYLFGVDIEGGLNLSELNLPNLPLIGQAFPSGETLKLALQVLAAGDTFTAAEIDGLNKLKGKGISLPQQELNKGLKLAALLRVGQETKPLSLPIGLGSQGEGLKDESPVAPATTTEQPGDSTKWINIQKTFGPIHVERVGIGYQTGTGNIALLLDAALTAAGLTLSLDGLGAEFALKDLANKAFKPTFHLNGLGIDYRSGPVEIGGSFLAQKVTQEVDGKKVEYTSYAGLAVIRTQKLTLSAIGSYALINGRDPSLFIYAVANYPLGGPAFFYVTGFAAGFGYNRALTLPSIDEIASFPLVAEAVKDGGPASLPSSQKKQQETLTNKLQQLERYLPPSVGDIFIAAGIKFTSFKQIDSFALLVVKFGRRFEIHLLGLSTLTAPPPQAAKPGVKTVAPIAEAQLVLKASFIPDEGFLGVRAQLTPNSYILSKDCHLNGGFAFYTWFEPHPNAGDFVLTLGGYHPKFIVPDHYPKVPRLALNWQVSPELHIKADAYFALTGSAIMAGGHLQATWESGDLRAWFVAGADFLLAWKPFHYDLELYIGIGVSYTFKAFGNQTLSVDLGANLHLWGPEFSGTATIHWSIISFTVNFGEGAPQHLEKLDWNTFKTSFLPKPEQICSIAVQQGLIRQMKAEGERPERWIVNPKEMVLVINSAIPLNKLKAGQMKLAEEKLEERAKHLAIAPMGIESGGLTSTCSISIKRRIEGDDKEAEEEAEAAFQVRPTWKSMPAGLWGKPNLTRDPNPTEDKKYLEPPNLNGAQLVENMLAGFEIRPIKKDQRAHTCDINQDKLQYTNPEPVRHDYGWQDFDFSATKERLRGKPAWEAAKTVTDTRKKQDQLVKALGLVNAEIDLGEPVDQGVLLAA